MSDDANPNIPVRWRWALTWAFIGAVIVAADVIVQWRGPSPLEPWDTGTLYNLGYIALSVLIPAAIGFAFGWWRDRNR
jgi:hypothetical protein